MANVEGLPLYRRIEADLRDRIRAGELAPGAQVETELELMERYGVSRATVRQALGGLIAVGALEVRRGLGTYVSAPRFEHTIGGFYSFSREIERHGLQPGTRVLDLRTERAADDVAEALDVAPGTSMVSLRRLRLAGPDPLVVETSYLPARRFPKLETVDFSSVRLYDTLMNRYGCRPTRARETFEPILLTADEAALLDQRRGEPALRVERVAYDQDDLPIEFCRSTVRGDRYRYSVELRDR
jgi:GntR family transcriptional regulator, N-acetylglucosamine utilization regulator